MVVFRSVPSFVEKSARKIPGLARPRLSRRFLRRHFTKVRCRRACPDMSSVAQVEIPVEGSGGGGGAGPGGGGSRRRALAHTGNTNFFKKFGKHEGVNKHGRKRLQSQSGDRGGKFHVPHKKRRKDGHIVPPTKFLLGGNICDPLNLGSLQDEEINRAMNAVTPKSSPIPTPKHRKGEVEVIIPPNINDPLNLNSCEDDDEYAAQLANSGGSPVKKARPKSKRKKKRLSNVSCGSGKEEVVEGSACGDSEAAIESVAVVADERAEPVAAVTAATAATAVTATAPALATAPTPTPAPSAKTAVATVAEATIEAELAVEGTSGTSATSAPTDVDVPVESAAQEGGDADADAAEAAAPEPAAPEPAKMQESPTKKANRRSDEWNKDRKPRKVNHAISLPLSSTKKMDLKDKIVSPVIWQPGQKPLHPHSHARSRPFKGKKNQGNQQPLPKFNPKDAAFQYGNYNRYYGYRNMAHEPDARLKCFSEHIELFRDKDVLDIGCNIGHVSLSVGRDFRARSVVGIDIDRKLIEIARKNVRHYVNCEQSPANTAPGTPSSTPSHATPSYTPSFGPHSSQQGSMSKQQNPHDRFFPISMPILYGPVEIPGITDGIRTPQTTSAPLPFPKNISFMQGNFVPESDALLALEQPQFDVILCLSVTKWFHLNWGDAGLKRAFRRMYAQLRPGGCLIVEPQGWPSYNRKKKLTETHWKNYNSIEFFPNQFREYLLSAEVGFSRCHILDIPQHSAKGFRRPISMFVKGDLSPAYSAAAPPVRSTVYAQANSTSASPAASALTPDPSYAASQTPDTVSVWTGTETGIPQRQEINTCETCPEKERTETCSDEERTVQSASQECADTRTTETSAKDSKV